MSTSLQFAAFKQACFSLNCNICYMYVYLQDLYFLLNYYLKCVHINESSDDIYNCFWKYCLNFKMKMYYLKGQCEFFSQLMKRLKCVYCQVKINPSQVSKYPDNSLDNVIETCHN